MSLLEEIQLVKKEGFDHHKVADLFKRYSSLPIVELLINTRGTIHFKTIQELLSRILESPLYSDFITDGGDSIQILLNDSDPSVRALVSDCMESHDYEFASTIAQLYDAKNFNLLFIILQVLVKQLCDQESDVGLKAIRTAKSIFSKLQTQLNPQLIDVLKLEFLVNMFKTALTLDKDIIQLRFMEIIITFANYDESIFDCYLKEGIMNTVVGIYDTDDILVKLNAVELIHKMGESAWCASFLQQQKFFHELLSGAFNPNEDLLVRKYQVILYSKFVGQRIVKVTQQHESQLLQILQKWLQGTQEEIEAALEVIGYFGQIKEGFDSLYNCEPIIQPYVNNFRSTNQTIKLKFLNSFQGIVKVDNVNPKSPGKVYALFSLFGNVNSNFDLGTLQNSAVSYIKLLNVPISETESCALQLLLVLIGWREILRSFVKVDIFQDYVVKVAQNKYILDQKKILQRELLTLCDQEQEEDFKKFSTSLREQLSKKTTMMLVEAEMK